VTYHIAKIEQNWLAVTMIRQWRQLPISVMMTEHLDSPT